MEEIIGFDNLGGAPSRIVTGSVAECLEQLLPADRGSVVVVTDASVHRNNRPLVDSLKHIIIGQGESSKTLRLIEDVYRQLMEMGADRNTFLLGMGGGVVTDITGFVAGTYLRGVRFGFVATTLLGQVDACIGGKNGVNLDGYKNIVGLIRQPEFVVCDPEMLKTLPDREFRSGLAEVAKAGIVGDPELFALLEEHSPEQIRESQTLLREVITRAIRVKMEIVASDEHERNSRRKLNMGHTIAHALEKLVAGTAHGEAVAAGISMISSVALRMGKLPRHDYDRITELIRRMGFVTEYNVEPRRLLSAIRYDKKREEGAINIVLPTGIGSCEVVPVTLAELEEVLG